MTGISWHPGEGGVEAAEIGGRTIGVVSPEGWWSSGILNVARPAASVAEGKAALEAEWAAWMHRAGLVPAGRPTCRCSQAAMRDRAVAACRVSAQDMAEGDWGPEGRAMAHMLRQRIAALPAEDHSP